MKKTSTILMLAILGGTVLFSQACKDDEDPEPTAQEFVADDNSFGDWANWSLVETKMGMDPSLGGAHAGNDSTSVRKIYVKDGQKAVDGTYPIGTLVVKHMKSDSMEVVTAMAKRGNNFDPSHNDWEYFMLQTDGKILVDNGTTMRGSNLLGGACVGCHAKATTDYIFTN